MKKCHGVKFLLPVIAATVFGWSDFAVAQLRIVDYNTASSDGSLNNPTHLTTVLQAMGDETVNGVSKPIDVLILQEQSSVSGSTQLIVNILNGIYGAGTYARSTFNGTPSGSTTGAGRPTLIYNTTTVQLLPDLIGASDGTILDGEYQVGFTSSSGAARAPLRYRLRPVGYESSADFFIYNSHYKSSDSPEDAARRNVEAAAIRANSNALGDGAHIIYAGDFNIYNSLEPMWATLTAAGNGQAFDPVNQVGFWSDNNSFKLWHTQSPVTSSGEHFPGQVSGGMDDRFDWQMITGELQDNEGMSIISGSYHGFGNNGTHLLNSDINHVTSNALNTAWSDSLAVSRGYADAAAYGSAVRTGLAFASDHIPVVAQYQLPAKMAVAVDSVPSQVIESTPLSVNVTVNNSAGDGVLVLDATGADELDYSIATSGQAVGSASGSDAAFGTGNVHNFTLRTNNSGNRTGTFTFSTTSPQVPSVPSPISRSYTVLDHANASFDGGSDMNVLNLDFGSFSTGSGIQQLGFDLFNLVDKPGFTAKLDFLGINSSGDTNVLSTNLALFGDLVAGSDLNFLASFDTTVFGNFSAVYTLDFSDDTAVFGAVGGQQLTLNLTGNVYQLGDTDGDGDVDSVDLQNVKTYFHISDGGDADNDGDTDAADFVLVKNNMGITPPPGLAFVPEPGTLALLAAGSTFLVRRRANKVCLTSKFE